MKPVWILLACLAALPAGFLLGRSTATSTPVGPTVGNAARPGGSGASAKALPTTNLLIKLKQTPGLRKKTALMLNHLAKGQPANINQLVEAAGNDVSQLLMLSDIALHIDPAGFIKALSKNYGTQHPQELIGYNFIIKWAGTDFKAAFQTCRSLPYPINGRLGGTALRPLFEKDPTAALKLAVAHPGLDLGWANEQKLAASQENLALVRALAPGFSKAAMIKAISANLSPDEAFDLALEDRHATLQLGIMRASMALVEKDPKAALVWVLANPDHPAAAQLARQVGDHLIKTNPAAAVEWAATHLSGPNRTRALEKAGTALQKTDPRAAAAARALLPESFKEGGKP